MKRSIGLVIGALVLLGAGTASAQTIGERVRGFISVNGGYQTTPNDFQQQATYRRNAEDGSLQTAYTVKSGPVFDVSGGAVVWRQLGVGVGVTRFALATPMHLTAAVPHPFFFNQPRSVAADVAGLQRQELAVHLQASAVLPFGRRAQVVVFGGPSFFHVTQDVVTDFTYTDSYPYDTAAYAGSSTMRESTSKVGVNVGGDVALFFTRQVGVGATVQYSGATLSLTGLNGLATDVKVGGVQAGGGLRLRF